MKQFLRPSLGVLERGEKKKREYGEKRKEIKVIYLNIIWEFWIKEKRYVFYIQEFEEKWKKRTKVNDKMFNDYILYNY